MKFELKPYHRDTPDEDFLDDVRRVTKITGRNTVTMQEYSEVGRFHPSTLWNRFGSWFVVLEKAGLEPSCMRANVSDEDLLANIKDLWIALERQPKLADLRKRSSISRFSERPYVRRFGSWTKALEAFVAYINNPESEDEAPDLDSSPEQKREDKHPSPVKNRTRKGVSERLRFSILLRDGFRCTACGRSPLKSPGVELHVDHIVPWSKGGESVPENLQSRCKKCNLGKGNAFSQ